MFFLSKRPTEEDPVSLITEIHFYDFATDVSFVQNSIKNFFESKINDLNSFVSAQGCKCSGFSLHP